MLAESSCTVLLIVTIPLLVLTPLHLVTRSFYTGGFVDVYKQAYFIMYVLPYDETFTIRPKLLVDTYF